MTSDLAAEDLPVRRGELLLGKYLIGETLGAGGMGVVVAAEHVQLGQKVAVKFLSPALRQNADAVARFVREARAAARIRSEHVVRVVDVSAPESDICYMVMEHLDGRDLAQVLRARGRLPVDEAVGYVLQACEAIAEAHGAGIVHRDLKPSNLFLTKRRDDSPLIKVLDFGISKVAVSGGAGTRPTDLTSTMTVMGSPVYMSPEQVRSAKNVDARTDVWALGVILHELVVGQPVYVSESVTELLAMIAADPPTPLRQVRADLPAVLEATVLACLQKSPAQRLPDVAALARQLEPLAPRWALVSVERIVGSSRGPRPATRLMAVQTDASGTGVVAPGHGDTLPLPSGTTSADMSGELLPGAAKRPSPTPRPRSRTFEPTPEMASPTVRTSGRRWPFVLGALVVVAVIAAVAFVSLDPSLLGRGDRRRLPPPRPIEGASTVQAIEEPPPGRPVAPPPAIERAAARTVDETGPSRPQPQALEPPGDASPKRIATPSTDAPPRSSKPRKTASPKSVVHRPSPPLTEPEPSPKDPLDGRR